MPKVITINKPTIDDGFSKEVRAADAVKVKLTPKQNAVIYCLQNGWSLITDCEHPGATVGSLTHQYHINGKIFWCLVDKGIIYQNNTSFYYELTILGDKIITKPVTF